MRAKLGLGADDARPEDEALVADLLGLLKDRQVDYTSAFRSLSAVVRGDAAPARALFAADPGAFDAWAERWAARRGEAAAADATADAMDRVNPVYLPRNHLVEEALDAATAGDLVPFEWLVDVVSRPFEARDGLERYAEPASEDFGRGFRTFCGT